MRGSCVVTDKGLYPEIAGEFAGHILDNNGNSLGSDVEIEIEKIAARIPLNRLKQVSRRGAVIVIAARGYKARPILMGLRQGIINSLVIDKEITEKRIEASGTEFA